MAVFWFGRVTPTEGNLTWNNAPSAEENSAEVWVDPLPSPGDRAPETRTLDVHITGTRAWPGEHRGLGCSRRPLPRRARRAQTVELESSRVAQAYTAGRPLRLVVYSARQPYHSGRYFTASDIEDWDEMGAPH